ncbi:MAG: NAD-dependent epimerase/dehydratase family protein [Candidatus Methanofastidiosa archaeon]|nr:NAD-dependent epimerase/dehydratase family protein [Candidatus Methanofastidiosa archaeon]
MTVALISGSAGLIGSEASEFFANKGFDIVGIDNDMRSYFFGANASTTWRRQILQEHLSEKYTHYEIDIRDFDVLLQVFKKYGKSIELVIHTASQPSHDWAAREPLTDFGINANGTINMLEATRRTNQDAVFIFTSTNKVYGDTPNRLPLIEEETRWEINPNHPYRNGIPENMSIDDSLHSVFGASKVAADIMVQEYGRYFNMSTTCFRGGCLTGPNHSGTELHGFLAYLMKCSITNTPYTVYGYKGKQVRDNIHSADLIEAMYSFFLSPRIAEVYNMGGGRFSNCSMIEAIKMCEEITGNEMKITYTENNRIGDHIWYISDTSKFESHFPDWHIKHNISQILQEIYYQNKERWLSKP